MLAGHPGGDGVVVVAGRPSYAESGEIAADALRILAAALPKATFLPALRRGNVFGALDMGLAPGILPGRVSLDAGRDRFTGPGDRCPPRPASAPPRSWPPWRARPARATSSGAAVRALVLLGADPLSDFPDHVAASQALSAGHFVIAVTGHPSQSVDAHADVVLPCAVTHERAGTTTNIEGRVSRLGPKLTAPGFAWPDWMIAAELATALGADLGVRSLNELADELEGTAPAYAGLTQEVLHSDAAHDGIVVPLGPDGPPPRRVAHRPHRAAGRRVGRAPGRPAACRHGRHERPRWRAPLRWAARRPCWPRPASAGTEPRQVPKADNYTLRLVAGRRLYDAGSSVTGSPSLTPLVPALVARANPYDLDRLGASTGDRVKVRSARGELILSAESDEGVPRGVVAIDFNVPGGESAPGNAVATLIDHRQLVTDVRLESV